MTNIVAIDGSLCNFGISVCKVDLARTTVEDILHLKLSETEPDKTKGAKRSLDDLKRFNQHWITINQVIKDYDCKYAIAEIPSGAQDARAAFAFGGITSMMACLPIPLVPVTPTEAKLVTGSKHADKEEMIAWAYEQFPMADWFISRRPNKMGITNFDGYYLQLKNEHLADSIAVAFAGLPKIEIK